MPQVITLQSKLLGIVIPAKAGIHGRSEWIPASVGMTVGQTIYFTLWLFARWAHG
jgi:hypothetical protein